MDKSFFVAAGGIPSDPGGLLLLVLNRTSTGDGLPGLALREL
jgi:hypothetical protein